MRRNTENRQQRLPVFISCSDRLTAGFPQSEPRLSRRLSVSDPRSTKGKCRFRATGLSGFCRRTPDPDGTRESASDIDSAPESRRHGNGAFTVWRETTLFQKKTSVGRAKKRFVFKAKPGGRKECGYRKLPKCIACSESEKRRRESSVLSVARRGEFGAKRSKIRAKRGESSENEGDFKV